MNLRLMDSDDVDFVVESRNSMDFWGEYISVNQISKAEWLKHIDNPSNRAREDVYCPEEGWHQNRFHQSSVESAIQVDGNRLLSSSQ